MNKFDIFNYYLDAVCVFSHDNKVVFKNNKFKSVFSDVKSIEKFKNRFSSDLIILTFDGTNKYNPIDLMLNSKENFHTICSYQNSDGFFSFYLYSFIYLGHKVAIFRNTTEKDAFENLQIRYTEIEKKYSEIKKSTNKFIKMQENAQSQVLKMGIINRISLIIRETNDIEKIIKYALQEINNLLGSFKTYFSVKDKQKFKIKYSYQEDIEIGTLFEYDGQINNKEIIVAKCLREFPDSKEFFKGEVTRIIIPIFNKDKFLGIISTFTKQRIRSDEHNEILQSIAVQLASSIIQSQLITQLNKKNTKLEKTLNQLKETQLQLINTEKLASLGQLVSGVAHEINTPLASINSNNNLIRKILSDNNPLSEDKLNLVRELNDIDIEATERISSIVKSLKRFVRLDEAEFQKADINNELDTTLKMIVHETKNNIEIVKNYSELPQIYCSVNMINQVFMNLLINACHSIKEKGEKGEIVITTLFENDNLIVKIKDNGAGIPLNIQNKIFNTGFTTKKIGLGSGIGLAISKKIIEMHKGKITFTSQENVGSEFVVMIPYIK